MTSRDNSSTEIDWPKLPPFAVWEDTFTTVHMWSQIVGKVRLALGPQVNHSWGSVLYVTSRGLTTSSIPYKRGAFEIEFDFTDHVLHISTSRGARISFRLEPMSVAAFYIEITQALRALNIDVKIMARPVEVAVAIPFAEDITHASYDAPAMHAFWRALVSADIVFKEFRARFIGKASPSHFFWGAFDLAVTRFSGRTAPPHPGGAPNCPDYVMVEAYSHELSSAGFWPGAGLGEAAFYSYAYPSPAGYDTAHVGPPAAYFHETLREYILPYDAVRSLTDPKAALLAFLQTTYDAAASLGAWDRAALERGL